jgi:hypothetical protein
MATSYEDYTATIDANTVIITFYYNATEIAVNTLDPNFTLAITINDQDVLARTKVSTNGEDTVVFTVSPNTGYSTVLSGKLTIDCNMAGILIDETQADEIKDFITVINLGESVSYQDEGETTVSMEICSTVQGNGMIHLGLYEDDGSGNIIPIDDPKNPLLIKAHIAFIDDYQSYKTPEALANGIVTSINQTNPLPAGYTLTANGTNISFKGGTSEVLYMYIIDNIFLRGYPVDLPTLQGWDGELQEGPWIDTPDSCPV